MAATLAAATASSAAAAAGVDSLRARSLSANCKCSHLKAAISPPCATAVVCDAGIGLRLRHASTTEKKTADLEQAEGIVVPRRSIMALVTSAFVFPHSSLAQSFPVFREFLDNFDGYTFKYPQNWIPVRGSGADIFFRDPFVLDENISIELSSPSSSRYKSVEDLGTPKDAGEKVLRQYLTEFMSTRLGVRRESNILSTSSRVADDGRLYYQVELNIKSYANNNELAVMPQDRITRLEWDRRYLSVLGVENNRLYELRLQTPENVFLQEEEDLRRVMDSFRVFKTLA